MAENIGTAYVQIVPTAKGISGKIEQELGGAGKSAGQSFSTSFGSVLKGAGKIASLAVSAASTAVGGIVKSAVSSFGEYEQLAGGVEKIFDGMDTSKIINDASKAYKDLGLSANQYLATINDVGATFASTMGAEAGYNTAKKGLQAISDYASGTGKDVDLLSQKFTMITRSTSSYQSIADQFSGILPATSAAFLEQAQNAGILEKKYKNLTEVPIDKYQQAVTEMLGKGVAALNLTGNTAAEAEGTFTGSLAMMQGAWSNLMTGMASDSADLPALINNLVESATAFAGNAMPMVQQALAGISALISQIAPIVASELPTMITSILPGLLSSGVQIVEALGQGLLQAIPALMPSVIEIINSLMQTFLQMAPQILQVGVDIILQLAQGITEALPTLIPAITDAVLQIVTMFTDPNTLTSLIQAGIDLMLALLDGLMQALPQIIEALPTIIQNLCDALTTNLPIIIEAANQVVSAIVENLPTIMQALIDAAPQIIESLMNAVIECGPQLLAAGPILTAQLVLGIVQCLPQFLELGRQVVDSIIQGLANAYVKLTSEGPKMIQQLKDKISAEIPKLVQQGRDIVKKIIDGIKQWADNLYKQAQDLIEKVKATIKGKIEGFGEVGKNIVNGIKEGLTSAWGELEKWFTEKINALKNKVKDVLKIESPSKVFADEIGRMIPLGIAQGIEDGMNALDTSVLDMTTGIVGTADQAMSAATYQSVPSASGDVYGLLANYLPLIANKEVNIKLEGGMDRFFRAMQTEARRNYQLTGAAL